MGAGDAPRRAPVPVVDRVVRRERSGIVRRAGVVAVMDRDQKLLATAEVQGEMLESLRARRRGLRATRRDVSDGGRCRGGTRARERPAAGRGDEGHARRAHLQAPKLQGILVKVIHRARLEGAPPGSARANAAGWHSKSQTVLRTNTCRTSLLASEQAIAPLVSAPKGPQPNKIIPILTVAHTKEQTTRGFEASREPPA